MPEFSHIYHGYMLQLSPTFSVDIRRLRTSVYCGRVLDLNSTITVAICRSWNSNLRKLSY